MRQAHSPTVGNKTANIYMYIKKLTRIMLTDSNLLDRCARTACKSSTICAGT